MQPLRLHLRGLTRFTDLSLDLSTLPPGLIAVVGPNGAGKTSLLESLAPGALYLDLPSRPGSLRDWMNGRDALLELELSHGGAVYRIVIQADTEFSAGRGKSETFLYRDGVSLNDGKVRTFREAVAKHFPSRSIFLASAFAAQNGSGNFMALPQAERKALFAELLGLARYQDLADRAREHRKFLDAGMISVDRDLSGLEEQGRRAAALDQDIALARAAVATLEDESREANEAAQTSLAAQQRAVDAHTAASSTRTAALRKKAELDQRIASLEGRVRTNMDSETRNKGIQERAESIQERQRAAHRLDQALGATREEYAAAAARLKASGAQTERLAADIRRTQREEASLVSLARELETRRAAMESLRVEVEANEELASSLAVQRADLAARTEPVTTRYHQAARDHDAAARAMAEAERASQHDQRRIELLKTVPCGGGRVLVFGSAEDEELGDGTRADCSECSFLEEAVEAKTNAKATAERLQLAEDAVLATTKALADVNVERAALDEERRRIMEAEAALVLDGKASKTKSAYERARAFCEANAAAPSRLDEIQTLLATMEKDRKAHAEESLSAKSETVQLNRRGQELADQRRELGDVAGDVVALEVAQRRLPEIQEALASLRSELKAAMREDVTVPPEDHDLARECERAAEAVKLATHRASEARESLGRARQQLGRVEGARSQLGDLGERRRRLEARRRAVEVRRAGFRLIEQGLGRNGVQALEIDCAGPEVSRLCNELLGELVGGRFKVALRTVQEASGGRRQKEVFDVQVFDSERNGLTPHDGLSGGQQVVVSEALKLSLAVFNAGRWGAPLQTLFRDECDSALDHETRSHYPAMLRRALDLGGFDRCFFVTHTMGVAEQADAVLLVDKAGGVRVVDPLELSQGTIS